MFTCTSSKTRGKFLGRYSKPASFYQMHSHVNIPPDDPLACGRSHLGSFMTRTALAVLTPAFSRSDWLTGDPTKRYTLSIEAAGRFHRCSHIKPRTLANNQR